MPEDNERETEAPFNMAIATLQRLDAILQQIRDLDSQYPIDSASKQKSYISLVKQFYINSVPLFKESKNVYGKKKKGGKKKDTTKKISLKVLQNEILSLKLDKKKVIRSGTQTYKYVYSEEKEKRINEILIDLQQRLSKFFMPGKRDTEGLI